MTGPLSASGFVLKISSVSYANFHKKAKTDIVVPARGNEKLHLLTCLHWSIGVKHPSICACCFHAVSMFDFLFLCWKVQRNTRKKTLSAGGDCVNVREEALCLPLPQQKKNPGKHNFLVACLILFQICTFSFIGLKSNGRSPVLHNFGNPE